MKVMKIAGAATVVLALTLLTGVIAPASHASVSFDFFYSDLSPHGSWMVSGEYGRVWQPRVYRSGWNPYHDGHWVYTDCGWAWVSDYTWGDVAYHYGTWVMDPRFGWVWVPGYTWAPAWVTFRTGPDYIGWAPVAPSFAVGFSSGGFSFGASIPSSSFVFVSTRDFAAPRVRNYIVPESRRTTIINNTTIVNNLTIQNNVVINRGPDLRTIERATRRTFRPQPIERVARVAPFTSVRREQLAVARDSGGGDRVRAAEPISARQPLPPRMTDQARRDYRRNPQLSQAPRKDQFRAPVETEAQVQRDRMQQQRDDIQQREQRREEIQRQHPQEQRQQKFQQQEQLRRQDEVRQQEQRQQVERQREQPAQEQRRYAQPERRQQIERQKEQSAPQERRQQDVQRQREPSVQQEQRQQQDVQKQRPQEQKQEQPQKPERKAPKKKNPDDEKKQDDGGGNN